MEKMNYTKVQGEAFKLWQAGFTPYLISGGRWIKFHTYPRISNGPAGGPLWPYIVVGETDRPPLLFKTNAERHERYPAVGIPSSEQEVTNEHLAQQNG
jgi:hypothetical protein